MIGQVKRVMFLILVIFMIVSMAFGAAENPPAEAVQAAKDGLVKFMWSGDLQHAEVGLGFQIHTISPVNLEKDLDTPLQNMTIPTGTWRFLVKADNHSLTLLTVSKVDGQWQAVSIGGIGLAKEISKFFKKWPPSKGFDFRFIRIYQAQADLMQINKDNKVLGFAPFQSARASLQFNSVNDQALLHNSEIIETLRERVTQTMLQHKKMMETEEE